VCSYAKIEGKFNLYLVGLMVSLKCILCSSTHGERRMDGSFGFSGYFTTTLEGLGLYKSSAPGLVSGAPILQWNLI
jgi:hypothetical protein